jgi:hypothetical protein
MNDWLLYDLVYQAINGVRWPVTLIVSGAIISGVTIKPDIYFDEYLELPSRLLTENELSHVFSKKQLIQLHIDDDNSEYIHLSNVKINNEKIESKLRININHISAITVHK